MRSQDPGTGMPGSIARRGFLRSGAYCRVAPKVPIMSECSKTRAASAWPGPQKPPRRRAPDWPLEKVPSGPTTRSEKIAQLPNYREALAERRPSLQAAFRGLPGRSPATGAAGSRASAPVRRGRDARREWLSGRSSVRRSRR